MIQYELLSFELLLCWAEEEGAKAQGDTADGGRAANHILLCTWISGCTLLFLALPSSVLTEWVRLEGLTLESPGPTSLLKQGHPRAFLRLCLMLPLMPWSGIYLFLLFFWPDMTAVRFLHGKKS